MQKSEVPKQFPQPADKVPEPVESSVAPLSDFMHRRTVTYSDGRIVNFLVIKLNKEMFKWNMANEPSSPKTVMAWRQELDADLVINGSYFDEEMRPTGFYKLQNQKSSRIAWPEREKQNNETGYTGMIQIRGGLLELFYLPDNFQKTPTQDTAVFLSYPTLIANGKSLIETNTQRYARRTVLAHDKEGIPHVVITENGALSLYELAKWLNQQPEQFMIAINLDGGGSTGLSYEDQKIKLEITSVPVPNVIYLNKNY